MSNEKRLLHTHAYDGVLVSCSAWDFIVYEGSELSAITIV